MTRPTVRPTWLVAAAAVAFVLRVETAVGGDASKPELQDVATADGSEKLPLPAAWTISPQSVKGDVLGSWSIGVEGQTSAGILAVKMVEGERDERLSLARMASRDPTARVETQPYQHVIHELTGAKGDKVLQCQVVRVLKRRGYLLTLQGTKSFIDATAPAFVAGAAKFESSRSEYPDIPDSYKRVLRDGYEYCLHPAVKESDVGPIHRFLLAQEAAYAKRYGPVPKPPDNPIVVVLHATADDAEKSGLSDVKPTRGISFDLDAGVIMALPLSKTASSEPTDLATVSAIVFSVQTFSLQARFWQVAGDAFLAVLETKGGRQLPEIAESMADDVPTSLHALSGLATKADPTQSEAMELAIYMAFFRSGAKPWSDAFASYVKSLRQGEDPTEACRKTLLALDQEKLRAAVEAFRKTFKPIKGK